MTNDQTALVPEPHSLVVSISHMKRRHLRQVMRIEGQVYPRPWSMGLFLGEIGLRGTRQYVVARVDGRVIGYGGVMWADGDAHITNVAVDPAWQRHAVATRLMLVLVRHAMRWKCDDLTLEVRKSNEAAQRLYFRFGFAPEGVRKAYYLDNHEDAILMWARGVRTVDYAARLAQLEQSLPGRTVLDPALQEPVDS
jgi:ribosomal-protein-alanine N-acetyltransferase